MATIRAIKNKIKSAKSTQQITKAMKMVSVSKFRKNQAAMTSLRPFAQKSREIMESLSAGGEHENRYMVKRPVVKRVCYVAFVGNRGLCGAYNTNVIKYLRELARRETAEKTAVFVGRWGRDLIRDGSLPIEKWFDAVSDTPTEEQGIELAEYLKSLYLSGGADKIVLVYSKFKNALSQTPASMELLPVKPAPETEENSAAGYIFEPDREAVLENIIELYVNNTVYSALLEAKTGEHASRITAMTAATDNTEEVIEELNLYLNRARQDHITTEISEIVGGAAALRKKE